MKSKIKPFLALFILSSSVHAAPEIWDVVAGDGATIAAGSGAWLTGNFNTNAYAFTRPGGINGISKSGSGNHEILQHEQLLWRNPPLNGGAAIKAVADSTTGHQIDNLL